MGDAMRQSQRRDLRRLTLGTDLDERGERTIDKAEQGAPPPRASGRVEDGA
jgi:hypothetical protein